MDRAALGVVGGQLLFEEHLEAAPELGGGAGPVDAAERGGEPLAEAGLAQAEGGPDDGKRGGACRPKTVTAPNGPHISLSPR